MIFTVGFSGKGKVSQERGWVDREAAREVGGHG